MSERTKLDKKKVIQFLTMFEAMGFEVIKSNYGQTALNTADNKMPLVLNNDVGYTTPLPYRWEYIKYPYVSLFTTWSFNILDVG